ncbi:hypothetical protein E2C01_080740 [Portunus trituberculatus]|uniref:Uncharacterized protein n=1 Tax=Portunus trituberculatus TaxID=210409 RepID=A0A5B7J0D9_PORTR|nr:hypothetical protein [Portunus trituberculatus]
MQKLRIAGKAHYLSKEVKYIKKGLFCVLCTKLKNAGKTLYLLKRLIHVSFRCFMKKKHFDLKFCLFFILHYFASKR